MRGGALGDEVEEGRGCLDVVAGVVEPEEGRERRERERGCGLGGL